MTYWIEQGPEYLPVDIKGNVESGMIWVARIPLDGAASAIRYIGSPCDNFEALQMGDGPDDESPLEAPELLVLRTGGREFVLFDGAKHGYDAQFCADYSQVVDPERAPNQSIPIDSGYKNVIIAAYYNIDYDDPEEDFYDNMQPDETIRLISGQCVSIEAAKRNGFDAIVILLEREDGTHVALFQAELA